MAAVVHPNAQLIFGASIRPCSPGQAEGGRPGRQAGVDRQAGSSVGEAEIGSEIEIEGEIVVTAVITRFDETQCSPATFPLDLFAFRPAARGASYAGKRGSALGWGTIKQ